MAFILGRGPDVGESCNGVILAVSPAPPTWGEASDRASRLISELFASLVACGRCSSSGGWQTRSVRKSDLPVIPSQSLAGLVRRIGQTHWCKRCPVLDPRGVRSGESPEGPCLPPHRTPRVRRQMRTPGAEV